MSDNRKSTLLEKLAGKEALDPPKNHDGYPQIDRETEEIIALRNSEKSTAEIEIKQAQCAHSID